MPLLLSSTYKALYVKPMEIDKIQKTKPLVPYSENSRRNRLPVHFDNEPKKHARFCAPRNVSIVEYVQVILFEY